MSTRFIRCDVEVPFGAPGTVVGDLATRAGREGRGGASRRASGGAPARRSLGPSESWVPSPRVARREGRGGLVPTHDSPSRGPSVPRKF